MHALNRFFQIQNFETGQSVFAFLMNKIESQQIVETFFDKKNVYLNFVVIEATQIVKENDLVQIFLSEEEKLFFLDQSKLKIIHSEDDFFIIEKPSGVNSVIDSNHLQNNVHFLLKNFFALSKASVCLYPVHRLDRLTSGLMIVAKNESFAQYLINLFKEKQIDKKYWGIVSGPIHQKKFIVSAPLKSTGKVKQALIGFSGRSALTKFKVIQETKKLVLLECQPVTGRTHQIRSHLQFIGHPIINDYIYGGQKANFIFLHSFQISFKLPNLSQNLNFYSKLPQKFQSMMKT